MAKIRSLNFNAFVFLYNVRIQCSSASFFLPRDAVRKRGLCCRLVSVRPSVTLVYCIHVAEDIVKLLSRPGSPIILVLSLSVDYQFQGNLFSGGAKHTGVGKISDFHLKSRFILETVYEIGPWLLWNVNRKS